MLNAKGIKAIKFTEKILRNLVWEMLNQSDKHKSEPCPHN